MLRPEECARRDAERAALRAWFAGDHAQPFLLERHEAYCVCDVLFPSFWTRQRFARRGLIAWLASKLPTSAVKVFLYRRLGAKIGRNVYIGPDAMLDPMYPELIELADDAFLGMGCRLFTHEHTATHFRIGRVRVGPGSVIGAQATVRSGVTIGAKATIGMLSFVNRDVPDGATVGGVPARPLRKAGPG